MSRIHWAILAIAGLLTAGALLVADVRLRRQMDESEMTTKGNQHDEQD